MIPTFFFFFFLATTATTSTYNNDNSPNMRNGSFHNCGQMLPFGNDPKYWARQAWANNVDLEQNAASDQCVHCLGLIHQHVNISTGSKMVLV